MKYALITLMALLSFNIKAQNNFCSKNRDTAFIDSVNIIVRSLYKNLPYIRSCEDLEQHARFIEYIDLSTTTEQLETLEPLIHLKNLKYLNLSYQYSLRDMGLLGRIKKLISLKMVNVPIDDLAWIQNLTSLEEFYFVPGNRLYDLNPLEDLQNLKVLDIRNGTLITTSFLNSLKKLNNLSLVNTQLHKFDEVIPNSVETLDIRYNYIKDFSFIPNRSKLTTISAEHNKIDDLSQLKTLYQLQFITLQHNNIEDISPLSDTNLDSLYPYNSDYLSYYLQDNPIETNPFNENFCPTKSKSRGVNWYCINKMLQQRQP